MRQDLPPHDKSLEIGISKISGISEISGISGTSECLEYLEHLEDFGISSTSRSFVCFLCKSTQPGSLEGLLPITGTSTRIVVVVVVVIVVVVEAPTPSKHSASAPALAAAATASYNYFLWNSQIVSCHLLQLPFPHLDHDDSLMSYDSQIGGPFRFFPSPELIHLGHIEYVQTIGVQVLPWRSALLRQVRIEI